MEENKKYYWLKLKRDFFKRHDIRIIESLPNGKDYLLFYLKLLVESIDHDGDLRFNDTVPYDENMLSIITDTNIDVVRVALRTFEKLDMVSVLEDKTIFMNELSKMMGSESKWAEQKRLQRDRKVINIDEKSWTLSTNCPTEKEIDKEKEKDIDNTPEKIRIDYEGIVSKWNSLYPRLPKITKLTQSRKSSINARLRDGYTEQDIFSAFDTVCNSDFLCGNNDRGWKADFDWVMKPNKFVEIIEGKYTRNNEVRKQEKPIKVEPEREPMTPEQLAMADDALRGIFHDESAN